MKMNQDAALSITEVSRDFKNAARIAHTRGEVYIYENDQPRYKLVDLETDTSIEMSDDEKIDFVAARILKKYRKAFEELAK